MISPEQSLIWFLRITGSLMLLAAALAVVMPHAWMSYLHTCLGLHELPALPIVEYLTRSLSALYVAVGAWCWFVSRDVRRYLPLLRFSIPVTFAFAVTLSAIDVAAGMPIAWTAVEAPFVLGWAAALAGDWSGASIANPDQLI